MKKRTALIFSFILLALLGACDKDTPESPETGAQPEAPAAGATATGVEDQHSAANPLLAEWTGPYGGVPAFDKMELKYLEPAMEQGMAMHLEEIDAIANNPAPPDFDNTIVAMEAGGETLDRVFTYFGIWSANLSTPEFRAIQRELSPRLAEYRTRIIQNDKLFQRIRAVYESDALKSRPKTEQRLVELIYRRFADNGATLGGEAKKRYAEINRRLAELHTQFGNNVLADEESHVTYITEEQTGGLPASFKVSAAAAAAKRDREGEYAILNTRSSMGPLLTFSDERELREQVWRTYYNRGDNGDGNDNNGIIAEIIRLRDERVGLLGFDNYAEWRLQDRMAKSPDRSMELMMKIWPAALQRVAEEVADMQAIADAEDAGIRIQPWDYRYYAEKVRRAKYDLDSDTIKQYLQLDKLREAMFMVAGELFNFQFTPLPAGTVPVFHEDVRVWDVTDKNSGGHIGLWYLDPFARTGKRSGAWATSYRSHTTFQGKETVLASNNSNFIEAAPGEPVLVSWDDAETLFHEFGHALHALSSRVAYPTLNSGVRDFTEFNSQLLERWLLTERVINNYLVHHQTGTPMPKELVDKIKRAATFNEGFKTTEYLASALVDMRLHMLDDPAGIDPDAFERNTLEELDMPDEIVMRHRLPHFGHIFSGEGYSAGYYGYIWSEALAADAVEAFAEAPGGFYDANLANRLVNTLYAPRNSIDPAQAYRAFRGRDADADALLRTRGFPVLEAEE